MTRRWAEMLFRHRRLWLAGLVAALAGASLGLAALRFDFTPQYIFTQSGDSEFETLQRVQAALGREDSLLVVLVRAPDVLAPPALAYMARLAAELRRIDGVESVRDLAGSWHVPKGSPFPIPITRAGEGEALRQVVLSHPLVAGRIVSRDGKAAILRVRVRAARMTYDKLRRVVHAVHDRVARLERPAGLAAQATGVPAARVEIVDRMKRDQLTFTPLLATIFFLLLLWLHRDVRAVVVPLAAVVVSILLTLGLLGAAGGTLDILNNVYPTLLFVIGLSDSIHLVARYREELARGRPQEEALSVTVRELAVACFLTSFTSAVGFASLATAHLDILRKFGLWAGLGIMLAYGVTMVLVPLAFSGLAPLREPRERHRRSGRRFVALGMWVLARPRAIFAASLALTAACAIAGSRVRMTNNLFEAFNRDDPIVAANLALERHFPGVVPFAVVAEWREGSSPLRPEALEYLAEISRFVEGLGLAGSPLSVADLAAEWNVAVHLGDPAARRVPSTAAQCRAALAGVRAALAAQGQQHELDMLYSERARMLRIQAWTGDHGAHRLARELFAPIRERLAADRSRQVALGLSCYLTGDGLVASQGINRLIHDLFTSLLAAFLIIGATMILLLRSVRTGLVSLIPNVVPLVVTLGFIALAGMDLRVTSVLVFTISIGLAVDDTIHFMSRFQEEWRRRPDYRKCILRTFRSCGRAMVLTSVLLMLGFAVLLTSRFPISRTFALCMEVTVGAALLGDLLLLPACLMVLRPMRVPAAAPVPATRPASAELGAEE